MHKRKRNSLKSGTSPSLRRHWICGDQEHLTVLVEQSMLLLRYCLLPPLTQNELMQETWLKARLLELAVLWRNTPTAVQLSERAQSPVSDNVVHRITADHLHSWNGKKSISAELLKWEPKVELIQNHSNRFSLSTLKHRSSFRMLKLSVSILKTNKIKIFKVKQNQTFGKNKVSERPKFS